MWVAKHNWIRHKTETRPLHVGYENREQLPVTKTHTFVSTEISNVCDETVVLARVNRIKFSLDAPEKVDELYLRGHLDPVKNLLFVTGRDLLIENKTTRRLLFISDYILRCHRLLSEVRTSSFAELYLQ